MWKRSQIRQDSSSGCKLRESKTMPPSIPSMMHRKMLKRRGRFRLTSANGSRYITKYPKPTSTPPMRRTGRRFW